MEQIYTPKQDYKVLVRCFTYNQSKYIEDALNGFAMQQTDFPFVCLVMDDCSTDGEQEVIKTWMERECDMQKAEYVEIELSNIILVPHKSNVNCTFAVYFLKQNLYKNGPLKITMITPWREHCEYEALCEGDDYWIHPQKLQMQADWLDNHSDYSMCHGDYKTFNSDNNTVSRLSIGYLYRKGNLHLYSTAKDRFYAKLEGRFQIMTLTTMYRTIYLIEFITSVTDRERSMRFMMGDGQLYYYMTQKGHIKYFPIVFAMYNHHTGSVTKTPETAHKFGMSCLEMQIFYCEKLGYEVPKWLRRKYNYAYINMLIKDGSYDFKYKPFIISKLNTCIIQTAETSANFRQLYKRFSPFMERANKLRSRLKMIKLFIYNMI